MIVLYSQEVLLHGHMKLQLLVQVGPALLVETIVKLEHQGTVLVMVQLLYIFQIFFCT